MKKKKKSYDMGGGLLKPMIGVGTIVALVALVWYAAANKQAIMAEDVTPSLIAASTSPLKERVEGETGARVPYQDMEVFDLLKTTNPVEKAENEIVCAATPDGQVRCGKELAKAEKRVETMIEHAKNEDVTSLQDVQKLPPKQPKKEFNLTETTLDPMAALIAQETKTVAAPVKAAVKKAAKPVVETVKAVKTATPTSGKWGVQLASFTSHADATKAISTFKSKHSSILSNLKPFVEEASVKGRNVYRVKFFGASSSSAAQSLCNKLSAKGQGCFKVKS
jgi:cell division septation protein DedD